MKKEHWMLLAVVLLLLGAVAGDRFYLVHFEREFKEIEKKRIDTSNKLNTAKIVYEDLEHVRDLVFKNMDFPGHKDSITHETVFFDFVTACVNDLKMKLVSVQPDRPVTNGPVTVYGYEIRLQGDFFSFGELCSKFENSRRLISLEEYDVVLVTESLDKGTTSIRSADGHKGIDITMYVNTYRVKKGFAS